MHTYHLQDEFTDSSAERGLLAALAGHPQLYDELCDVLISDLFVSTQDTWQPLVVAMDAAQCPCVPTEWLPAPDPHATVHRLVDLQEAALVGVLVAQPEQSPLQSRPGITQKFQLARFAPVHIMTQHEPQIIIDTASMCSIHYRAGGA